MRDTKDTQTAEPRSTGAARWSRLKARREAMGYRHTTAWIHEPSEQLGYAHGLAGGEIQRVPDGVTDNASYMLGWLRGREDQLLDVECANCLTPSKNPQRAGDLYDPLTGAPRESWYCCSDCYDEHRGL